MAWGTNRIAASKSGRTSRIEFSYSKDFDLNRYGLVNKNETQPISLAKSNQIKMFKLC